MRHITAHISIWNKLGWIGIICYFVFAAAAPEVLSEGNTWVGMSMALLCVVLISLPWKKLFNVLALVGMMAWLHVPAAQSHLAADRLGLRDRQLLGSGSGRHRDGSRARPRSRPLIAGDGLTKGHKANQNRASWANSSSASSNGNGHICQAHRWHSPNQA